jgi:predicted AAA+ superfamily ATPase
MSAQKSPLSYENILKILRRTARRQEENARQIKDTKLMIQEVSKQMRRTDKKISELGSRIGEIVENMVAGNIIEKFQDLGYDVTGCSPRKSFKNKELGIDGEVDLLLDDGDVGILIEVKTTLETADVRRHIERLEKYRRYADARGIGDKQRYIGAVAGAVVKKEAAKFAQENGMYVIVQSGEAVEIIEQPKGFKAKEW